MIFINFDHVTYFDENFLYNIIIEYNIL